jgi:NTP pyrophosphatase (non-canonical NTP hydrolase)
MLVDDYADWASTIRGTHGSSDPQTAELSYLGLGLAGECGEVVELIKKLLRDGKLDTEHLCEELGDVAFYWARLCVAAGKSPSEILARSQAKIDARLMEKGVSR